MKAGKQQQRKSSRDCETRKTRNHDEETNNFKLISLTKTHTRTSRKVFIYNNRNNNGIT